MGGRVEGRAIGVTAFHRKARQLEDRLRGAPSAWGGVKLGIKENKQKTKGQDWSPG